MNESKRFFNPHVKETRRTVFDVLLWKLGHYADPPHPKIPEGFFFPIPEQKLDPESPTVTWINHSTALIKIDGIHILTDPVWSKRCSPISFIGPKRNHPPALPLSALPKIDLVLLSHDHYDHLDKATVTELQRRFPEILWLVPYQVKAWFTKRGITQVHELGWWEEKELALSGGQVKITGVPAQHFSGRTAVGINPTLWMGWVLERVRSSGERKLLYFVGDTGYNPYDFKAIGSRWKKIDLSLIPIGSYSPRKFMQSVHIAPEEAVKIHTDVHSLLSIGVHWKTFNLADEPIEQPPYDLFRALQKQQVDPATFLVLPPGKEINW